jgi:hypothetical protein
METKTGHFTLRKISEYTKTKTFAITWPPLKVTKSWRQNCSEVWTNHIFNYS